MSSGHYCDDCAQAYYKCVCGKTNKQITELHNRTMCWVADNAGLLISDRIPRGYTEKFAELIIRECINIAACAQDEDMDWDISGIIKDHFGVKE